MSEPQYWLAVGTPENWHTSFSKNYLWGLRTSQRHMWEEIRVGEDVVFFYITTPVKGIVGYGLVREKKEDGSFEWVEEHAEKKSIWPLRVSLSPIIVNPASHWTSHSVTTPELSKKVRSGFQKVSSDLAHQIIRRLSE